VKRNPLFPRYSRRRHGYYRLKYAHEPAAHSMSGVNMGGDKQADPPSTRAPRRRIYLMRHGQVTYFDHTGKPYLPEQVPLTAHGRAQATAAGQVLAQVRFDRVITSGLPRTLETAECVLSELRHRPPVEIWPELVEIKGGRLRDIPEDKLEEEFYGAFQGVVQESTRFLRGESVGELMDRVHPAIDRFAAESNWDTALLVLHGGVNRAILSYAITGSRMFLGSLTQSPGCINVIDVGSRAGYDWVIRGVNHAPTDIAHEETRLTTMEELLLQYRKSRAPV
jgi:broad specificity phosphatase PhoE